MRPDTLLASVFFCSGFTGLVYQVGWQRLLTLNYGVGAVSTALIVSVFMLGLGLGSLAGGRLAERTRDTCAWYAAIEAGLGIAGIASVRLIPALGRLTADAGPAAALGCTFILLCVPTFLMGISLPLLTTIFVRMTGSFITSVGHLYFLNTLGACLGALLTGYVLVPLLGLDGSITLAAGADLVLALIILLARGALPQYLDRKPGRTFPAEKSAGLGRLAYLLVFVTGFIAIGYEIIWYRVIGVLVKDSPYAFSTILAVYLAGIALGSRAIHRILARKPNASRRSLFLTIQFLIGLTVLTTFAACFYLTRNTPLQWFVRHSFETELHPSFALILSRPHPFSFGNAFLFFDVVLWPMALMFVPTLLMGASFPLISSLALSGPGREGRAVGTTYFFGVLGNVLGGLLTGFVLLPAAGTEYTILALGLTGLGFGYALPTRKGAHTPVVRFAGVTLLILAALAGFPGRGRLYAVLHEAPTKESIARIEEGLDAVVVTYQDGEYYRNFINGQGHGYRPGPLFYAEAVEGLTNAPSPQKVLVIGFGAGTITEAALVPPEVRKVTVVELCGSVIRNLRKFPVFAQILDDSRVETVIDDGRRFLERTPEKFDLILMDPVRTTSAYSNNLHSREFFALAGRHLDPGGVLMVGGVGESCEIPRTLLEVFPHVRAFSRFSLASDAPLHRNRARLESLLGTFPAEIQADIWELTQDALEGPVLRKATAGCRANTDLRPASEYYLGLQLRQFAAGTRRTRR